MRYPVLLKSLIIAALWINVICQLTSSFYISAIDEKYLCKGETVYSSIGIWVNCIGCANLFPEINVINWFCEDSYTESFRGNIDINNIIISKTFAIIGAFAMFRSFLIVNNLKTDKDIETVATFAVATISGCIVIFAMSQYTLKPPQTISYGWSGLCMIAFTIISGICTMSSLLVKILSIKINRTNASLYAG